MEFKHTKKGQVSQSWWAAPLFTFFAAKALAPRSSYLNWNGMINWKKPGRWANQVGDSTNGDQGSKLGTRMKSRKIVWHWQFVMYYEWLKSWRCFPNVSRYPKNDAVSRKYMYHFKGACGYINQRFWAWFGSLAVSWAVLILNCRHPTLATVTLHTLTWLWVGHEIIIS